jgi:general stress protein 26
MNDEILKKNIFDYINRTKLAVLGTVRSDQVPALRVMGKFALDGLDIVFSTPVKTGKVEQIAQNPAVSFYFQHEGQPRELFRNVTITGTARRLTEGAEVEKAIRLLDERIPKLNAKTESGEKKETAIFRVTTKEIKYLDYSLGRGKEGVRELIL